MSTTRVRIVRDLFIPMLAAGLLASGAAGSWRFDRPGDAHLDYGDLPLVTPGRDGAFSFFCTVKFADLDADDRFVLGAATAGAGGWSVTLDQDVEGTGHLRRLRFLVSAGMGTETERYTATTVDSQAWVALGGSFAWTGGGGPDAMDLYLDGLADSETPRFDAGRAPLGHDDPFTVGASSAAGIGPTGGRVGYVAVWDGAALTADEHATLAAGSDPRSVRPADLVFFARLEDFEAEDVLASRFPTVVGSAAFSVDRWPHMHPLVVALGDAAPTAIRIMSHVGRAGSHRIEYTADAFPGMLSDPVAAIEETDFVTATQLTGLAPGRTYAYRVLVDDVVIPATTSTFTTAPAGEAAVFAFAYASCSQIDNRLEPYDRYPFHAFDKIRARDPDFLVHSGDVWYADLGGHSEMEPFNAWNDNTVEGFARKARETLGEKHVAAMLRGVPTYCMPDDHEWKNNISNLPNFSGGNLERANKAYDRIMNWTFQQNPPRLAKAVEDNGLWYTFRYGGVDFFFLDIRTQRSSNSDDDTKDKKMLGPDDRQFADLVEWLESSTGKFKVVLCPGMVSRFGTTGSDSWGGSFSVDSARVIAELARHDDVVFFAGDVHWSGAIRMVAHPCGNPAHDLHEFIGCPFGGHLSAPRDAEAEKDIYFAYEGRAFDPERTSTLEVEVDTTVTPATMIVRVYSYDPADDTERLEYEHFPLLSRRTCAGDVDRDGLIDFCDLLGVLGVWGTCGVGQRCPADFDGNGVVDTADLLAVLGAWGECSRADRPPDESVRHPGG